MTRDADNSRATVKISDANRAATATASPLAATRALRSERGASVDAGRHVLSDATCGIDSKSFPSLSLLFAIPLELILEPPHLFLEGRESCIPSVRHLLILRSAGQTLVSIL